MLNSRLLAFPGTAIEGIWVVNLQMGALYLSNKQKCKQNAKAWAAIPSPFSVLHLGCTWPAALDVDLIGRRHEQGSCV